MTDDQLNRAKRELREEMNANGFGWIDYKWIKPPKKYELRNKEFSCIDMINSILAYQCNGYTSGNAVLEHEEHSWHNYLAEYVQLLGRDRVVALIQGQIDDIVTVRSSVFTDDEGVTYNSIIWKEK